MHLTIRNSVALALIGTVQATITNQIASQQATEDSSAPSWFDGLGFWHVTPAVVPPPPPIDDGSRDMVFGAPLTFSVFPVNRDSSFLVNMTFLDDGGDRVQSLTVGSVVVSPRFALTPKVVYTAQFNFTSAAVTPVPGADGQFGLTFSIASLAGPNAILSSFALFSSNPNDPPLHPASPPVPTHDLPRLTPRPSYVQGTDQVSLDLMGTWLFDPSPSASLLGGLRAGRDAAEQALSGNNWSSIVVPGEYTLQGFRIAPGDPVVYQTEFSLPDSWSGTGLRTKLRCDGVYSNGTVYINGAIAGGHLGGFTPFELDITSQVAAGQNNITVVVVGATLADSLASATQYATHDLGGISRKIYLVAVPTVSVADVHVVTTFSGQDFTQANLFLNVSVANDGAAPTSAPVVVSIALSFKGSQEVSGKVTFDSIAAGTVAFQALNLSVSKPALWDPEHPQLHDLTLSLASEGPSETVAMRVGFREVRIVNANRISINGRVIKARGTTRHEAHPLTGRSLWSLEPAGKQWERDIIMFRNTNINYIRTSHYPPAEELMIAADELGMLIELEMPFCWASGNSGPAAFNYTVQVQREAMVFLRNHPSVIQWSLGNESPWTSNFDRSLALYLREVDWTRPFMFDGGSEQPIPPLDVLSVHYPSFDGPGQYSNGSQPTLFGEYAHLNCYNRRELVTDPGVRDIWGLGIEHMWELIYRADGVLGACYWAGIDDIFYMPSGKPVGYGPWGVIDAWRRAKPETFLVQQFYSPVKVHSPAPGSAWAPTLLVDNRHDFTDLAEISFSWEIVETGESGLGTATGPPHTDGLSLVLSGLPTELKGTMQVHAKSPRGFDINSFSFPLQAPPARPVEVRSGAAPSVVELPDGRLQIQAADDSFTWFVSADGSVSGNTSSGALLASGPTLMVLAIDGEDSMQLTEDMPPILPFNDPLDGWALSKRSFSIVGDAVVVVVAGAYKEATGTFAFSFSGDAHLQSNFSFVWSAADVTPRQIGLVFAAPAELASLSWRRTAPWSVYPLEHIGRPAGDMVAINVGPAPGNQEPTGPWSSDPSPLGGMDFTSTKHNITVYELGSSSSRALAFLSDGVSQHGRAWAAADGSINFLCATLSNEGGNPFSREGVLPHPTVTKGSVVAGSVLLRLGSALRGE